MIEAATQQGMPHFSTIPWQTMPLAHPHTDGYVYGDHVPDYIFLLMETQNDFGGESFFVDGEAVLERLRDDPQAEEILPLLSSLIFDQTESEKNGGLFQGRQSEGPLFTRRDNGRLQWKRMLGRGDTQSGCRDAAEKARTPLSEWDSLRAPRSVSIPAICLDVARLQCDFVF